MVVVVARNIRRGGLHYAHFWMVGADTEPVGLGLSASMVEFGISTILENAWGKKTQHILMLQIKMNSVQEMCGTNKNLLRVIRGVSSDDMQSNTKTDHIIHALQPALPCWLI